MNSAYPRHRKFSFTGQGSRYFGIWAVNIVLTILSLGLYYPWAKAAIRKYLWNETSLEGDRFVFHGTGKEMFRGFIIAYGLIAIMIGITAIFPLGILLLYLGMIILGPIAIFGAWRYRLSRTSWRGIYFSFRGDITDFLKLYFKNIFFTIITFGIYASWMRVNIMQYLLRHSQFGQYHLSFKGEGGTLFGINILGIFLCYITLFIYLPWYITSYFNFTIDNTHIHHDGGVSPLKSTLEGSNTFFITFTNMLMIVFSLGIAFPWAIMRRQKLFTESVNVSNDVDLDNLVQDADNYTDATGDDLVDILDMDLGF